MLQIHSAHYYSTLSISPSLPTITLTKLILRKFDDTYRCSHGALSNPSRTPPPHTFDGVRQSLCVRDSDETFYANCTTVTKRRRRCTTRFEEVLPMYNAATLDDPVTKALVRNAQSADGLRLCRHHIGSDECARFILRRRRRLNGHFSFTNLITSRQKTVF